MRYQDGEIVFDTHLEALLEAHKQNGVVQGLEVTPSSPPNNQVHVGTGKANVNYTRVEKTSTTDLTINPSPTYPRKDIVVMEPSGAISVVQGTAEPAQPSDRTGIYTARPKPPDIPTGAIILAEIWVSPGPSAVIGAGDITDRRVIVKHQIRSDDLAEPIGGGGGGLWDLIAKQFLPGNGIIDLTNLNTSPYRFMRLYLRTRCSTNSASQLLLRFNGATSNYHMHFMYIQGSTVAASGGPNNDAFRIGMFGNTASSYYAPTVVDIWHPGDDYWLGIQSRFFIVGGADGNNYFQVYCSGYMVLSPPPVNRVTVYPNTGQLASGTGAWLYGLKEQ